MQFIAILGLIIGVAHAQFTDSCSPLTASCDNCTSAPGCGWCSERHRCMQGGDFGPCNADECAQSMWMARSCDAVGAACAAFSTCTSCAANDDCGWCGSEQRCVDDSSWRKSCMGVIDAVSSTAYVSSAPKCAADAEE